MLVLQFATMLTLHNHDRISSLTLMMYLTMQGPYLCCHVLQALLVPEFRLTGVLSKQEASVVHAWQI